MLYKVYQKETYSDWPTDILAFARTNSEEMMIDPKLIISQETKNEMLKFIAMPGTHD